MGFRCQYYPSFYSCNSLVTYEVLFVLHPLLCHYYILVSFSSSPTYFSYCPRLTLIYHFLLLTFLFFPSPFFPIWFCSCSPHSFFNSYFYVLSVVLLKSWCSCSCLLYALLISFLLLFYDHYSWSWGKTSLCYAVFFG